MPHPYEHRSHPEGSGAFRPLRKIGLETPLVGRIWGENKRLVFSPPDWYTTLVALCLIGGGLAWFGGWFGWRWVPLPPGAIWVGPAVFLAGVWALLSMEYVVFDLKAKTYFRREGHGLFKKTRRGSSIDIDAVVVYCENYALPSLGQAVIYRTVVHWKHARVPLLVTERQNSTISPGSPMNAAAGPIASRAQRYASALGVPFFDNSYFHSPAPQSPI